MKPFKLLYLITALVLFAACSPKAWKIAEYSTGKIAINASLDSIADKSYLEVLRLYQEQIGNELNFVIGQSVEKMTSGRPESVLSNFSADMLREVASSHLDTIIDIAIINMGGLRASLPKGDITKREILELMPFENEMVVLWLKGDLLEELIDVIAQLDGEGVSGIRMGIKDKKAVDVTVNGEEINKNKLYAIATSDFLAGGNDHLIQLALSVRRINTGIKIRDVYINYISDCTKKGKAIQSTLDGRIHYVE